MPDTVEGQDIALAVLGEARDSGLQALRERYGALLIRQAERLLRDKPTLRSSGQAEDLVQDFLVDRVISRPREMLGPTSLGVKPLWPRLSLSFRHYCIQILRRLHRQPKLMSQDEIEAVKAPDVGDVEEPGEVWASITRRIGERQDAIRRVFRAQAPASVPLRHLLLLGERLYLAQLMKTTLGEADPRYSGVPIAEHVSRVAPWSEEEQSWPLPPRGIPLGVIWRSLTSPTLRTDGNSIAQVLGTRRNTWDRWMYRARSRVKSSLGPETCRQLFPHWRERLTAEADGPSGQQGGS